MFLSNVILFPIVSYKNEKNLSVTTDFPLGLTLREATLYVHSDLQLFTSQYPGCNWVNNALINEGDKGLRAEGSTIRG